MPLFPPACWMLCKNATQQLYLLLSVGRSRQGCSSQTLAVSGLLLLKNAATIDTGWTSGLHAFERAGLWSWICEVPSSASRSERVEG